MAFSTTNNKLVLGLFNDGSMLLKVDNNDITIIDNENEEQSLRQVSLDIFKT